MNKNNKHILQTKVVRVIVIVIILIVIIRIIIVITHELMLGSPDLFSATALSPPNPFSSFSVNSNLSLSAKYVHTDSQKPQLGLFRRR